MIFVLEGPDFAGKSTLAAQLVQNGLAKEIWSNGPPPADLDLGDHYLEQVRRAATQQHVVFDRLHVGELIYGPILRGRSLLDDRAIEKIERALDDEGATKVHVTATNQTLIQRFRGARGDDLITKEEHLLTIAERYRSLLGDAAGLRGWATWQSGDPLPGPPPTRL